MTKKTEIINGREIETEIVDGRKIYWFEFPGMTEKQAETHVRKIMRKNNRKSI